jgi:hypothetical protein
MRAWLYCQIVGENEGSGAAGGNRAGERAKRLDGATEGRGRALLAEKF